MGYYKIEAISFDTCSGTIDFIPIQIFDAFPGLAGLTIENSNFPTVKNKLFSTSFSSLKYLGLSSNRIQSIQRVAFQNLTRLVFINLAKNKIEILPYNIFKYNPKLEYVDFSENKIKIINPQLFQNFPAIETFTFEGNQCANTNPFYCKYGLIIRHSCNIVLSELNKKFEVCHQNCLNDSFCAAQTKVSDELLELIDENFAKLTEIIKHFDTQLYREFWKQFL
jgi:hypothetical protein